MKKLAKFISLLASVAMLVALPGINTLTVSAAEPTTYSLGYTDDGWRWQISSTFDESKPSSDIYYLLNEHIKDGDVVVIYGGPADEDNELHFPVRLSNLTLSGTSNMVIVYANGIDSCYVLSNNCIAAINSNVTNAYVYNDAIVSFNKNVTNMVVEAYPDSATAVSCGGTVGEVIGKYDNTVSYHVWDVEADKLYIEADSLKTDSAYFSPNPPSGSSSQSTASTTQSSASTTQSSASDDYDDVPKTGESNMIFLLLGLSAICFLGSRKLSRA